MARVRGRNYRSRRVWLPAVGGLLVAASMLYAVVQLAHGGLGPSDTTGLLGLPIGVAFGLAGLWKHPDVAELTRDLADLVKEDEQRQWRQLIGDDTQRINLTFTLHPEPGREAEVPAPVGHLFGGDSPLPDVAAFYHQTRPRRLVVTGGPGAGKTVLAVELMLALLEGRREDDLVPVRLPLTEWDTTIPLPEWLASYLVKVYDWPAKMAHKLVRQRRLLPVLDGLDEMDPTAPDGTPSPDAPRARTALEALNAYQDGRAAGPVILTCRTHHYEALGKPARLLDSARVEIDPVTPSTAHTYLRLRAHDPRRWQPVLDALEQNASGTLGATLSTPWRLCLAATVYAHDGDPADLLQHATPADLDEHLLARFAPAATILHPHPHHPYAAGEAHRWLARLAAYLDFPGKVGASPRTDLLLHQLWPLAGRRRVRATDAVLTTLVILLPLLGTWLGGYPPSIVFFSALAAGLFAARASVAPPARAQWGSLPTKARRLVLTSASTSGLLLGLAFGLAAGLNFGPAMGLTMGLGLGLTGFFTTGIMAACLVGPPTSARPRDPIRNDLSRALRIGLATGLALGFTAGLAAGLSAKDGFGFGLFVGTAAALTCGVGFGGPSGRRYLVFLLCSRRKLPLRLGVFLDWACAAGLLRYAGAAYQFRHRELQQWLARHPAPPPV